MPDRILNKNELIEKLHSFNEVFKQVNIAEGTSEGEAEDQQDLIGYFIDQFEGWLDLTNTAQLVKEMKEGA